MTSLSARRALCACIVSAAALVALAVPGTASASDLGEKCSGANIKGLGSTFQNPAQLIWIPSFNTSANEIACNGTQGSKGTPKIEYLQGSAEKGSGACLHAFGAESAGTNKYAEYTFCGTDEAPNANQKKEIEEQQKAGEATERSLETLPVAQGAVATIVHLPEGCKAKSEIEHFTSTGIKKYKLGRLVFDNTTLEGIYRGTINTWKQAVEAQGTDGHDSLSCTGGAAEEEEEINRVVRLDHSGTTHIFKAYLGLVNGGKWEAEAYPEEIGGKKTGCGKALPAEEKTWNEVAEACENQRWPAAAKVVRPAISGNPGVIAEVAGKASSIGYADLAVARENGEFSKKFNKETKTGGGENKKGTETAQGEQNYRFWAEIEDKAAKPVEGKPEEFADAASNGDVEKKANSNCGGNVYIAGNGEKFPPKNTRELWNAARSALEQKKYNICGLTYDLAFREYKPYFDTAGVSAEEGKARATTAENYLLFEINTKEGGGGKLLKNHDYEGLASSILKESEIGIKEIGYAEP